MDMMTGPLALMALVASLLGGGPNDLLDYLSTQDYWKAKSVTVTAAAMEAELAAPAAADLTTLIQDLGSADFATREKAQQKIEAAGPAAMAQLQPALKSTDPEVVSRTQAIIENLARTGRAQAVRKLMVLRTLGELKDQGALPLLRPLLTSKELFVAEYAAAAMAAIEGKKYTRPGSTAAERAADMNLLPADVGAVAQIHLGWGADVADPDKIVGLEAQALNQPKAQVSAMIAQGVIQVAEQLGNVRLDCVTVGAAQNITENDGYIAAMARGVYDRKALTDLLAKEFGPNAKFGPTAATREDAGVQIIQLDEEMTLLMPSNGQIILLVGDGPEKLPIAKTLDALKAGKGGLAQNAALAKVLQTVDVTKPIWAAAVISESYRQVPFLAPFDTATLTTDIKTQPRALELKIRATGSDKDKTVAAVEMVSGGIKQAIAEAQQMVQAQGAVFGPIVESMQTIKVAAEGGNATMTGSASGVGVFGALAPIMGLDVSVAPVQVNPAPAAPAPQAP